MEKITKENTYVWYTSEGWKTLNEILVNLSGLGIGEIPITNLEFVPAGMNYELLCELINADGCTARYDAKDLDIYVKIV